MDVIQSAIMTSSLINLPRAEGEPGLQFGPRTHMHAEATVSVISRYFFFFSVSGIMGKFLAAVMVSLLGRQYWSVGLPAVNTLDGSPRHLVQTIVVQRRAVTTLTP